MDEIKGIRIVSLTGEKEYGIEDSEARQDVQQIVEGAPEAFDTFKEIAEYIAEDGATAAEIIKNVAANAQGIADEITRAKAAEEELEKQIADEAARATAAVAAEKTRAEQAEEELREKIANAGTGDVTTEQLNAVKDDVQANTTAINNEVARATQAELDAVEKGRQLALRTLYIAAGAEYNDTGADVAKTAPWGETVTHKAGCYYLNGLGDITEDEMAYIYNWKGWESLAKSRRGLQNSNLPRTLLTTGRVYMLGEFFNGYNAELSYHSNVELTVLPLGRHTGQDIAWMPFSQNTGYKSLKYFCGGCKNLKEIGSIYVGYIQDFGTSSNAAFYNCQKLEGVYLYKLATSITFESSPLLRKDSLLYMINNANLTSAITITLHAEAYARLENDADIVAALADQPLITLVSA